MTPRRPARGFSLHTCDVAPLAARVPCVHIGTMFRLSRILLSVCLALSLSAAGQAAAASKGVSPVTGAMTLCIGQGIVVVFTDEDGQPVTAPHLCPDCTLALLAGLSPPDMLAALPAGGCRAAATPAVAPVLRQAVPAIVLPRGPPVAA